MKDGEIRKAKTKHSKDSFYVQWKSVMGVWEAVVDGKLYHKEDLILVTN